MTVRVPTDRIPPFAGTAPGQRQLVQAVGGDMSIPVSSAAMSLHVAAPPDVVPDYPAPLSGAAPDAGNSRKEDGLPNSMPTRGTGRKHIRAKCFLPVPLYRFRAKPSDSAVVAFGRDSLPLALGFAGQRWE